MYRSTLFVLTLLPVGCTDAANNSSANQKTPTKPAEIGEFDKTAGKEEVKLDAQVTNPVTGPLEILKKAKIELPMLAIEHAVNIFNATEGRYPQSHEEFMTQVIAANKIQLPALPAGLQYQYDVEGHRLVIVNTADGKTVQ